MINYLVHCHDCNLHSPALPAAFPFREFAFLLRRSEDGTATYYDGITILACVGYGTFFLVVGLFFRNPIIPAVVLYILEWANFLMAAHVATAIPEITSQVASITPKPILKKISVIHYLNSLAPVPVYEGPFAVPALPTPAWIAVPSLILVTTLVLFIASRRIRHMEIQYGNE